MTTMNVTGGATRSSIGLILFILIISACSLDQAVGVEDSEIGRMIDRKQVANKSIALAMYHHSLGQLKEGISERSWRVGLFTDELTNSIVPIPLWIDGDARKEGNRNNIQLLAGLEVDQLYRRVHSARINASQATGVLKKLADPSLNSFIAAAYAVEGYSILMLAEDYCSGIPITDIPFEGDIKYGVALTTDQLFAAAVAKFDSALSFPHDSQSITTLIRIGKARAHMGEGKYDQAALAVAEVAPDDAFYVNYTENVAPFGGSTVERFWTTVLREGGVNPLTPAQSVEVVNREGGNGMVWFSDPSRLDPRLPVTTTTAGGTPAFPLEVRQRKFTSGVVQFPLARWIEAQMVRAENALYRGEATWIDYLNEARNTVSLTALDDPLNDDERIDLLFRERALWFYLEGGRLADYRRLVRQYQRSPYDVYPVGPYLSSSGRGAFYGEAWVFTPPKSESENNFRYKDCIHTRP